MVFVEKLINKYMKKLKTIIDKLNKFNDFANENSDVLGINEDVDSLYSDLFDFIQKANEISEAVLERSDDPILIDLAEKIKKQFK